MYRSVLIIIAVFFSFITVFAQPAQAAECTVVYGGGKIDCANPTASPTPTGVPAPMQPVTQTQTTTTLPLQTKGGLPINKPVPTMTAPATGPEAFGLIGLIPAAAAGFYLRKKRI